MEITETKSKGGIVLNILNNGKSVVLHGKVLDEICRMLKNIKGQKSRVALNFKNVSSFFAPEILNFIKENNLSILSDNPNHLLSLSLASKGFLPPVFLNEEDFSNKKRQFVKRNFYIA